jgi:dipeptidase
MHAADKLIRRSQSVGSLVGNVSNQSQHYYVTGAGNPCLSPFFPIFSAGTLTPAGYLEGDAEFNAEAYWWECERLHRKALWRFTSALKDIQPRITGYEQEMLQSLEEMESVLNQAAIDRHFLRSRNIVGDWGASLENMTESAPGWLVSRYWQGYNKLNGL